VILRVVPLIESRFRLDGGAMFGVVPKVLWSRTNPADGNNRISMAMRALYVEGAAHRLLIDSGAGTNFGEKMLRNYVIETKGLRAALEDKGIEPDSITDAVATHLHFDHAGGFCYRAAGDRIAVSLPRAIHHIPIEKAGLLRLADGVVEIFPGVTLIPTDGHTPGHQVILISTAEGSVLYCGDLIPLASHVNLPFIMAYDHFPLKTLEEKKRMLARAADEGWILFFEHDPEIAAARVRRTDSDGFAITETVEIG
jgi:glyoxylase-like metal-dependent hydrolase (beta-lactamase superfamily II)